MIKLELSTHKEGVFSDALMVAFALSSYKEELFNEWIGNPEEDRADLASELAREMRIIARVSSDLAIALADELQDKTPNPYLQLRKTHEHTK